jgi:hypothetical protein
MGFDVIYGSSIGEYFNRAHLVLNNTFPSQHIHREDERFQIPFLSIGAEAQRGNGSVLGVTDSSNRPGTLEFTAKLWDMWPSNTGQIFMMYATTYWSGRPRMLFINLYGQGQPEVANWSSLSEDFRHLHWPWPIADSYYYPGADTVFIDLERLDQLCGSVQGAGTRLEYVGHQRTYRIDLTTSFRCLSARNAWDTPMPAGAHPINGIHWANENIGKESAIWTSVHGMKMLASRVVNDYLPGGGGGGGGGGPIPYSSTPAAQSFADAGAEVLRIRRDMEQACRNDRACWARQQGLLRSGMRPTRNPEVPERSVLLRELSAAR